MTAFWVIELKWPDGSIGHRNARHAWKIPNGIIWVDEHDPTWGGHYAHRIQGQVLQATESGLSAVDSENAIELKMVANEFDGDPCMAKGDAYKYAAAFFPEDADDMEYLDLNLGDWKIQTRRELQQLDPNVSSASNSSMFELNDLLFKSGVNPKDVLVMRHTPTERKLARVMPFLVSERPELFNAYQRTQALRTGKSMEKRDYLASFLGLESGRATFIGLYEIGDGKITRPAEYWSDPRNLELRELGMKSEDREVMVFELTPSRLLEGLSGRLEIKWTKPDVSWFRLADKNAFTVSAIHSEGVFDAGMPDWHDLILSWRELAVLPSSWKSALQQWRGVYLIFDESDGRGYVGSAYGADNILGRWLGYASSGHGGNKQLKLCDPNNFRFSILQRVSPDMPSDEVIEIEASWKKRLHTRDYGLNAN